MLAPAAVAMRVRVEQLVARFTPGFVWYLLLASHVIVQQADAVDEAAGAEGADGGGRRS